MADANDTVARIIQGAISAVSRYGMRKFSMSKVSAEAGVSRGTLYRYFRSKDEILDAVGAQVERSLRSTFDDAIAARPGPEHRLEVVLQAMMDYRTDHPETTRLIEGEPAFALSFLTREFGTMLALVADAMDPVLQAAPPVRSGAMRKKQLAEVFLRVIVSTFLVPSPGSDKTAKRVAALWDSMVGGQEPPRRARARAAG